MGVFRVVGGQVVDICVVVGCVCCGAVGVLIGGRSCVVPVRARVRHWLARSLGIPVMLLGAFLVMTWLLLLLFLGLTLTT